MSLAWSTTFVFVRQKKNTCIIQTMTSLIFNENCTDIPFELHTTLLPSWVDLGIVIKERTYKDTGCTLILMIFLAYIESDAQNLRLIDGCLQTISSHFFAKYMNMFHKTDVQTIIFRSWTSLKLNWFKSYDTNVRKVKKCK